MQFILGGKHEELKEGYQLPGVARKQLGPETLLHFLLILDKANKLVVFVEQLVVHSISCSITSAILLQLHSQQCQSVSSLSRHQHVAHDRAEQRQLTATSAPSKLRESK